MSKTSLDEQIANALVENAINDGFQISINKGDEAIVNRSRNSAEITKAMFRTNIETLTLNVEERRVGIITLVYGNTGISVISDHTDAPHINRLVEHTLKELEPGSAPRLQELDEPLGLPEEKTGQGQRYFRKARNK